uniref:translation initiation factor IF-2-like n=1 Tax=Halichoerus grypus TaxID=9711 RepID=UPI001659FA35|nr:translation initiation factor IF-2-like [Halichoerus grypus]
MQELRKHKLNTIPKAGANACDSDVAGYRSQIWTPTQTGLGQRVQIRNSRACRRVRGCGAASSAKRVQNSAALGCHCTKNTLGPNNLRTKQAACNFGEPGRRPGKNRQVQGAQVHSRAGPAGQGLGEGCLRSKSKDLVPLNNPAPRVTRVSSPRATASAGSHRAHGFWRSRKCGPARGNRALPVPGLRAWCEGGRVLPFAPTPSGRRTRRSSQNSRVRSGVWRRDVAGGHRGQREPESSLSAVPGAGRRRRPQTPDGPARPRQAGMNPTQSAPAPCTHPVRRAPGSGPGPWPSAGATARAQKKQRVPNGKRELFLCLRAAGAPATSGLPRALAGRGPPGPRALGGALGAKDGPGIPSDGLTAVGGQARGATRKLSAQVCCALEEKAFPYKAQRRNAQAEP